MDRNLEIVANAFLAALKPNPLQTVSEWADAYRYLSTKISAEPGKWRTDRVPYLKEIMDCLSPFHPAQRVVFMKSSQVGATESALNWLGYVIKEHPGPIMIVEPTVELAKRLSKQRIDAMIEDTPAIRTLIKEPRQRDSGNTILMKEFAGGLLIITGANSAIGLRSMPVRYLFLDEVDAYPHDVEGEGDPLALAIKRTATFQNRKIFIASTPTIKGVSKIEKEYELSNKKKYYVPCPFCKHMQVLVFENLRYKHEGLQVIEDVTYECEKCGKQIGEQHKKWMCEHGKWIASQKSEIEGFFINSLYSPVGWISWKQIVSEYLEAKLKNDVQKLKTFTNTVLGITWEEDNTETIEEGTLNTRVEDYTFPEEVAVLTAGVDIQEERIEVLVVGWGIDEESWHIEHKILIGHVLDPHTWQQLSSFLDKSYTHPSGAVLKIACTCIDSGYMPKKVYDFVKKNHAKRVYAIKGSNQPGAPLLSRPRVVGKERVKLFQIGVSTAKDMIFARLKLQKFGSGYMHFNKQCDDEYFRQLTAEKAVLKYVKGYPYREYVKIRPRNEILDLWVYNIAAYSLLNPDIRKLKQMILNEKPQKSNEIKQNETKIKPPKPFIRRQRGWVRGWI